MDDLRNDIAVIGMSGAFPGADNIDEYWQNLLKGKCAISDVCEADLVSASISKASYQNENYVLKTSSLSNISHFDADFFGYTPAEAKLMDPQHRLFLQHSWKALESAGMIPDEIEDSVGVYAGCGMNRYLLSNIDINTRAFDVNDFQKMLASEKDYLTTRVSHKLNLRGPSINVQTACSTSLVAIQLAALSLQTYQCDIALSGGVAVNVPHKIGYQFSDGLIFSKDGYCKPFSNQSNGTIFGEGVGVVVLKRLADAIEDDDTILAVIKGAATNNDGRDKVGFTAPSVQGQSEVISLAQELADIEPHQVQFIETHGTATKMGDPIELAGLNDAFGGYDECYEKCALGTLKANIGHLDVAAGVASFIKSILVVKNKLIPPNLSFNHEFPQINEASSPFYFNQEQVDLTHIDEVHAGVSSFGVGGTNAHIILASPPQVSHDFNQEAENSLLLFCAKSKDSLVNLQKSFSQYLSNEQNKVTDAVYTLLNTRKKFSTRTYTQVIKDDNSHLTLKESDICFSAKRDPEITFMFPGQGSQYLGMSKSLYDQYEVYRGYFDECIEKLRLITGKNYHDVIMNTQGDVQDITQTHNAQISLFVVEYCLAKTFIALNIKPKVMIGHSIGEYVAACLAGIFSLEDALLLVFERGKVMAKSPKGGMVAIFDSREKISNLLSDSLSISIINSPTNTVISGSNIDIDNLVYKLISENIPHKKLINQHAFHSALMEPILNEFFQIVSQIQFNIPHIKIIPSTPGFSYQDMSTGEYWVQHLRKEVNFHQAIGQAALLSDVMLEVGPGSALCTFVQDSEVDAIAISSMTNAQYIEKEQTYFLNGLAQLWCSGINVDFQKLAIGINGDPFGLPTYEFEKQKHWLKTDKTPIESKTFKDVKASEVTENHIISLYEIESELLTIWKNVLDLNGLTVNDDFFSVGGDSLLSVDLFSKIKTKYQVTLPISTLFTYPTIAKLAQKLIEVLKLNGDSTLDKRDEPWDTSVVMHGGPENNEKTLFIVGGVGGNVNNLYDLAKNLGYEYKVVGLQTRGILEHNYHDTVEDMAEDHIKYIKQHQPKGPYFLAGYSYGAYTAFEIAKQFEQQGEKIDFLGLLDVYAPGQTYNAPEQPTVSPRFIKWKTKFEWYYDKGLIHTLGMLKNKLFGHDLNESFDIENKAQSEEFLRYERFFEYWTKVSELYLGGVVNCQLSLFMSPGLNYREVLWGKLDNSRGWSKMTSDFVNVTELGYGHLEMMEGKNAPNLARLLSSEIKR